MMKFISILTAAAAITCVSIPWVFEVAEEVDYYILAILCVIAAILAKIEAQMERKGPWEYLEDL